jgi:hypothetical protein
MARSVPTPRAGVLLLLGGLLAACGVSPESGELPYPAEGAAGGVSVRGLEVSGESRASDYRRAAFGDGWADTDRNGCGTRNDILARDLHDLRFRSGSRCVVVGGTLRDPYSGRTVRFVRGGASEVDIDHVVPLAEAWRSGAWRWTTERRREFANDPLNLLATDAALNRGKGDQDVGAWLPRDRERACRYAGRYVAVKRRWHLSVDSRELSSLRELGRRC